MIPLLLLLAMAQEPPRPVRDLSEWAAEQVAREGMPALAVCVTDGDRTRARGVAGVRVRGGAAAASLDDSWHVGSCTKSMTATLWAVLAQEEGGLGEDARPLQLFPEFAETADPSWEKVTMRGLLTNRAGVLGDLAAQHPALWGRSFSGQADGPTQRRLLLQVLTLQPNEGTPGAYLYSNAGFAIAGAMLETHAGVAFEELMRTRLFAPLGMTSAGFGPPGTAEDPAAPDAPWGHDALGQARPPRARRSDNPEIIAPAGRVHLTMEDWARYARFHLRGERARAETRSESGAEGPVPLLPAAAVRRLHEPEPGEGTRYAAGWLVAEIGDPPARLLAHSGSNTMWCAVIWLAPDLDLAVLLACNDGARGPAMERLARELFLDELDSGRIR